MSTGTEENEQVKVYNSLDELSLRFEITERLMKDLDFEVGRMNGPVGLVYDFATSTKFVCEAGSRVFETYKEMVDWVKRTDAIYEAYIWAGDNIKYSIRYAKTPDDGRVSLETAIMINEDTQKVLNKLSAVDMMNAMNEDEPITKKLSREIGEKVTELATD